MSDIWRVTAERPREPLVPWERTKAFPFIFQHEMLLFLVYVLFRGKL